MTKIDFRDTSNYTSTPLVIADLLPIPDWLLGLKVGAHEQHDNEASVELLTADDTSLTRWEGQQFWMRPFGRFGKLGSDILYRADHPDGRVHAFMHKAPILQEDGTWMTPKDSGFVGAHYNITLADGREVTLRGPWDVGAGDNTGPVSYRREKPNYLLAGYLQLRLLVAALNRFAPGWGLYEVSRNDLVKPSKHTIIAHEDHPYPWSTHPIRLAYLDRKAGK